MKKIKLISLIAVFLLASLGMSGTLHYCAGKIKTISMEQSKHKGCGACDDGLTKKSCCTEESTVFQYDDFQFQKTSFSIQYTPSYVVSIPYYIPLDELSSGIHDGSRWVDRPYFLQNSCDIQSRLCVFII